MKKYPHYKLYYWNGSGIKRLDQKEYETPEDAIKAYGQWNRIPHNLKYQAFLAHCTSQYESHISELANTVPANW